MLMGWLKKKKKETTIKEESTITDYKCNIRC